MLYYDEPRNYYLFIFLTIYLLDFVLNFIDNLKIFRLGQIVLYLLRYFFFFFFFFCERFQVISLRRKSSWYKLILVIILVLRHTLYWQYVFWDNGWSGPEVINLSLRSTLLSMNFSLLINRKMQTICVIFIFIIREFRAEIRLTRKNLQLLVFWYL